MCAATSGNINSASSHVSRAHADAPPGALREARAQLVQHRLQQSAPAFTVFVLTPHPPSPWSYLGVNTSKGTNNITHGGDNLTIVNINGINTDNNNNNNSNNNNNITNSNLDHNNDNGSRSSNHSNNNIVDNNNTYNNDNNNTNNTTTNNNHNDDNDNTTTTWSNNNDNNNNNDVCVSRLVRSPSCLPPPPLSPPLPTSHTRLYLAFCLSA